MLHVGPLRERCPACDIPPVGACCRCQTGIPSDLAARYQLIEVTSALANRAMLCAEQHGLRGYNAMQLAAGFEVHVRYLAAELPAVTFTLADTERNAVALA